MSSTFAEYEGLHRLSRAHTFGNVGHVRDVGSNIYKNVHVHFLTRCIECSMYCDQRVHCDKTKKRSVQIFIQYERSSSLVF